MVRIPSFNSKGLWFYPFLSSLLFLLTNWMKKYISHGQFFQTNCSQRITSLRRRGLSGSPNQVAQWERDLESLKLLGQKCKVKFCPFSPRKLFPEQLSWGYHLIIFSLGKVPSSPKNFLQGEAAQVAPRTMFWAQVP